MADHTSDLDPKYSQNLSSTTSTLNVVSINGGAYSKESLPSVSLEDEFTPAAALESGLDLSYPFGLCEFNDDFDLIDWDSYHTAVKDYTALNDDQEVNDFDDKDPEEKPFRQKINVLASNPDSDAAPGFSDDLDAETAFADLQKPNSICQNTMVPTELSIHAVEGLSGCSDISVLPDYDFNGSFSTDFELLDNIPGLGMAQGLQITPHLWHNGQELPLSEGNIAIQNNGRGRIAGDGPSDASLVASAPSSEPDPKKVSRTELTEPHRHLQGYELVSSQSRPENSIRIQRNKRYSQNHAYTPLNEAPKAWDIFEYTKDGELDPSMLLSAEEITRFLFTHPLHQGYSNLKDSPLKLRVHKTPASSAKRFPNGLFCRFKDCPMRTINQGQLLIVIDELSVQHPDHDLYLNSVYVHLFCIEAFCNFAEIVANLNVTTRGCDARKEPGRKNRFVLSTEEEKVVKDFVDGPGGWVAKCPNQQMTGFCPHFEPQSLPYKGTLCHQLNVTKLHYGGLGRINLRKDREEKAGYQGANITRHLGDLSKEAQLREFSRAHKNQNKHKSNPKTVRYYRADGHKVEEQPTYSHSETDRQQSNQLSAVIDPYQPFVGERCKDEGFDSQDLNHGMVTAHKKPSFPGFEILEWDPVSYQPKKDAVGTEGLDFSVGDTLGISPRTISDSLLASIRGPRQVTWEGDSEGEMELEILAAQRQRRLLEIEDAKDRERECELRKLKLQKAEERKRAREIGDDDGYGTRTESEAKRQRQW